MTPFWEDDHLTLYGGDCRAVLASMPAESVHCVVTSPPYWGLRDYGTAGQLGLEPTPEEYVANMVAVFREVRRVLRNDGTLWLNLGDSYANDTKWGGSTGGKHVTALHGDTGAGRGKRDTGLKPKDLVGIPWRVAFALQADGWYLRSDIIWAKPNPMPESVTDRPTKAHEYLFLLSKAPRYFFDADAVREGSSTSEWPGIGPKHGTTDRHKSDYEPMAVNAGRNLRSVWNIATEPYPGAHFATFPRKLVEPCVKAGTSERGVCPECGAPWEREATKQVDNSGYANGPGGKKRHEVPRAERIGGHEAGTLATVARYAVTTTGWRPSCACSGDLSEDWGTAIPPVPAAVLDPFAGSGTTLLVAQSLGRRGVGIDLNPDYLKQALTRNAQTPLGLVG